MSQIAKRLFVVAIVSVLIFQAISCIFLPTLDIKPVFAAETTYSYSGLISGGDVYEVLGSNLVKASSGLIKYDDFSVFDSSRWTWDYNSSEVDVSVENGCLKCVFSSGSHVGISYNAPLSMNDGVFMGLDTGGYRLEAGTDIVPYFTNFTVSSDTDIFGSYEWYRLLLTQYTYYVQRKTSTANHFTANSGAIGSGFDSAISCLISNKAAQHCEWYLSSNMRYSESYGLSSNQLYFTLRLGAEAGKTMYLDSLALTKGYYVTVQVPVGYQAVLYDNSSGALSYIMSVSDNDNNGEIVFDIHDYQCLVDGYIEVLPTRPVFSSIAELWMDNDIAFMFRMDDVVNNELSDAFLSYMMENQPAIKATMGLTTFDQDAYSWARATTMVTDYGWEASSHTRTHYNAPRTETEVKGSFLDIEGNTSQICLEFIFSGGTHDNNDLTFMHKYGVPIGGKIYGHTEIPGNATAWLTFGSRDIEITDTVMGSTAYANARTANRKSFVMMAHPQNWANASSMSECLDVDFASVLANHGNWFATIAEFYSYVELRRNCTTVTSNANGTYTITTDFTDFVKPAASPSVYDLRILKVPLTYVFQIPEGVDASEWVVLKNNEPMLPQNYGEYPHMGLYDSWWEGYYCDATTRTMYVNVIGNGSDLISFSKLDVLSQPVVWASSISFNGETFGTKITSYDWTDNKLTVSLDGVSGYSATLDICWQKQMDANVLITFENGTTVSAQDYYNVETNLISIPYVSGPETILISSTPQNHVLTVRCIYDGNPVQADVYVNDLSQTTDVQGRTQFNLDYGTYDVRACYLDFEKNVTVLVNENKELEISFTTNGAIPEISPSTIFLLFLIATIAITFCTKIRKKTL